MELDPTVKCDIAITSIPGKYSSEFLSIILFIGKPSMNNVLNPPLFRRLERWIVGSTIAVIVWLLEKVVLRSIIRGSQKQKS